MLEGKFEKLEFQEMSSSPHRKIEMSKNKTKMIKKWTKRNGKSKEKWWKREMNKKTMKNDLSKKWSLVKITLKYNLGIFILSFGTPNPGLHYVPEKSILIEHGYLDWRVFFLEKFLFFYNQQGCCLFSSAKILGKLFTCSGWIFWVHNRTIEKWKRKKKKK